MGLDMYLYKNTYVQYWEHQGEENYEITVTKGGKPTEIQPKRIAYVKEQVAYWRKANQIHAWFVKNVQRGVDDCGDYYVDNEKLKELVDLCKQVLKNNMKNAVKLLPPQEGFFFGDTSIGEWYKKDLENTIAQLEPLLKEKEGDFMYHSSW